MHMFDAFLRETLEGGGQRCFTDSAGNVVYSSFELLASALAEPLIVPETVAFFGITLGAMPALMEPVENTIGSCAL